MIRDTPSYSLDGGIQFHFFPKNKATKPIFLIKSLIKRRKVRPKSVEATDSDQYNTNSLPYDQTRRRSCYCTECGQLGKKQHRYHDIKVLKIPKPVKKLPNNLDRRSTLNVQSVNRSVFYRRNTQKKEEKTELIKSPTYDLGEAKSPGWFLRQMTMRKSVINVQKLMDDSAGRNPHQPSSHKIDETSQVQSQQTIHMPNSTSCIQHRGFQGSPGVRIRTLGAYDIDHHRYNSPKQKEAQKISPYLSFRQINLNLLVPLRQKSNSSTAKKPKRKLFSYSKS